MPHLRQPELQRTSDSSLLVRFGDGISRPDQDAVLRLFALLQSAPHPAIRNLHPGYGTILISFDPLAAQPAELERMLRIHLDRLDSAALPAGRTVEIPVCYAAEYAPDLEFVASHSGLSADEVVRLHSASEYFVYFLGFSPGFPYLGDLPHALAAPRLTSPRLRVPAGSVAIGGSQTGVYPTACPGGWHLIGRTPLRLFSPAAKPPAMLAMGDRVRFRPIERDEFESLSPRA